MCPSFPEPDGAGHTAGYKTAQILGNLKGYGVESVGCKLLDGLLIRNTAG